jgi:hypothetical protein
MIYPTANALNKTIIPITAETSVDGDVDSSEIYKYI